MHYTGGTLWIVATPIGNLDDISKRALDTLRQADLIAAEDTRHSRGLLQHFGIDTPMLSLHEHNEADQVDALLARLRAGEQVALISDAGTPLISDPGFRIVRAARAAGVRVSTAPGPCAAVAALSISGLPSDRFVFEGFLPARSSARRERLRALATESRTLVFYESCHRISAALEDMRDAFGAEREAVLARELSKLFETVLAAPLADLLTKLEADPNQRRGEFVVLLAGSVNAPDARVVEGRRVAALLAEDLPPAKAAKLAAAITGAPRKALYGSADQGAGTKSETRGA